MLTKVTAVLTVAQSIRLKGRSYLVLVLTPEQPFDDWLVRLDGLASRSAGYFPAAADRSGYRRTQD